MTSAPALRTLATEGPHWSMQELPDLTIHLDLGAVCLLLNRSTLTDLSDLLHKALVAPIDQEVLAQTAPNRGVWCCAVADLVVVIFDAVILRFRIREVVSLARLCRVALTKLSPEVLPYPPHPPVTHGAIARN
jgi:hypothetical protein